MGVGVLVGLSICGYYSFLIYTEKIHPVFATWFLFGVAVSLSFKTYWSTAKHSFVGNIGNTIDFFSTLIILFSVVFLGKNTRFNFTIFEIWCLIACGVVLVFWKISKQHVISNLCLQIVITVAYFPTFETLWYAKENTEPFLGWTVSLLLSVVCVIIAIVRKDFLGIIYSSRGFVSISIMLILMLRIILRN